MNIAITFRHLEASEPVKDYANEKVAKLQKFLRQPMRARVTLAMENKKHRCETEINAGAGHFVASEASDDMYASIDAVVDKLERQINHQHGISVAKKKGSESAGAFAAAATRGDGTDRLSARFPSPTFSYSDPTPVKLVEIVTEDRVGVVPPGTSIDKRAALTKLAELLSSGLRASPHRVLTVLEEREAVQSTGIGDGVAMPHGTIETATGQVGALLVCPGGVAFDAIDDRPAKILCAVVGPRQAVEHLKVLARVSRILRSEAFRRSLLEAPTAAAVYALLRSEDDQLG